VLEKRGGLEIGCLYVLPKARRHVRYGFRQHIGLRCDHISTDMTCHRACVTYKQILGASWKEIKGQILPLQGDLDFRIVSGNHKERLFELWPRVSRGFMLHNCVSRLSGLTVGLVTT
jgi:hypothetical protein